MNEEEAIERLNKFKTITVMYGNTYVMFLEQLKQIQKDVDIVLSMLQEKNSELEKKDKQIEELKEIDEKMTWTVNKVIAEYIPDYELISLVNRYKDESFIPRVEVEKILNDRKK